MSPELSQNQGPQVFRLFADPSFLEGMARVLDLSGSLQIYNLSRTTKAADLRALASDWFVTGQDIGEAMRAYPHAEGAVEERAAA